MRAHVHSVRVNINIVRFIFSPLFVLSTPVDISRVSFRIIYVVCRSSLD